MFGRMVDVAVEGRVGESYTNSNMPENSKL